MYRIGEKYRFNGTEYRTLSKIYGLRFVVSITGQGGQFYIVNLFVAIGKNDRLKYFRKKTKISSSGSGIGFMVIAGIVADVFFMYFHKSRTTFRQGKISVVDVDHKDDSELLERP